MSTKTKAATAVTIGILAMAAAWPHCTQSACQSGDMYSLSWAAGAPPTGGANNVPSSTVSVVTVQNTITGEDYRVGAEDLGPKIVIISDRGRT